MGLTLVSYLRGAGGAGAAGTVVVTMVAATGMARAL